MILKNGNQTISTNNKTFKLGVGVYNGTISNVSIIKNKLTNYGMKDILEVTVDIKNGVTIISKKTTFYITDYEESRFIHFMKSAFGQTNAEDEYDVQSLINRNVKVEINHNTKNGITYDNIAKIIF